MKRWREKEISHLPGQWGTGDHESLFFADGEALSNCPVCEKPIGEVEILDSGDVSGVVWAGCPECNIVYHVLREEWYT